VAELRADLALDAEEALGVVDRLGLALDQVASAAAVSLAAAVEQGLAAAEGATVEVAADTSAAEGEIQELGGEQVELPVEADTAGALDEVEQLESEAAEPVEKPIEVDAGDATAQLEGVAQASDSASTGLAGAGSAALGFRAGSFLATGQASALGSTLESGVGGGAGIAIGSVLSLGGALGLIANKGFEAASAQERFARILGDTADEVATINVGTLNADLSKLAITLGSDDEAALNAAASIFQFGRNSGAAEPEAARFAETVLALSARAVALNPALGDVGSVAESMSVRLARGGRFAANFGLDLNAAEINARALGNTGKTSAGDLSIYEKAVAASQIATEKYGDSLQRDIVEGAQNPQIQLRRLGEEFANVLEKAGQPLVSPTLDLIDAAIPSAAAAASILGNLATAILPAVSTALDLLAPPLRLVAGILETDLGSSAAAGVIAFVGISRVVTALGTALLGLLPGLAAPLGPIALLIAGVGALAVAFSASGSDAATSSTEIDKHKKAVLDDAGAIGEHTAASVRDALATRNQVDDLERAGISLKQFTNAAGEAAGSQGLEKLMGALDTNLVALFQIQSAQNGYAAQLVASQNPLDQVIGRLIQSGELNKGLAATIVEVTSGYSEGSTQATAFAGTQDQLTTASERAQASLDVASAAADKYRTVLEQLVGIHVTARSASLAYDDSVAKANETLFKGAGALFDHSAAANDSQQAILSATEGAFKLSDAVLRETGDVGAANQVLSDHRQRLVDLLTSYGIAPEQIDFFLTSIGLTPQVVDPATGALAGLASQVGGLPGAAEAAAGGYGEAIGGLPGATAEGTDPALAKIAAFGFTAPDLAGKAGAGAASGFGAGVAPIPALAGSAIAGAGGQIGSEGFKLNVQADRSGHDVGITFAFGIRRGILDGTSAVTEAAREIVRDAERAARAEAESGSPSRLFARIGADLGAGLAQGIPRGTGAVAREAAALVRTAASSVTNDMRRFGPVTVNVSPPAGMSRREARDLGAEVAGAIARIRAT